MSEQNQAPLTDKQIRDAFLEIGRRLAEIEAKQEGAISTIDSVGKAEHDKLIADFIDRDQKSNESYTSIIMVIGYGALFTLWTQLKEAMPPWYFFLTGLLALVSAMLFVIFELLKVGVSSHVNTQWTNDKDIGTWFAERQAGGMAVNRFWAFFFYPSVITGVSAGLLLAGRLIWNCLKAALH